jgi:plastocyanin
MKIKLFFLLIVFSIVIYSCKKQDKGNPGPNEVWLEYKAFNPTQLAVDSGATVTFTNKDNADHSVTSNSGIFDSGKIKSGNSFTHTFTETGTYYYYCNYHSSSSSEQGAIIVR